MGLSLPMEVGEWVLVKYVWDTSTTVEAKYEREVGTAGKATCVVNVLPHQAPSVVLDLLQAAKEVEP